MLKVVMFSIVIAFPAYLFAQDERLEIVEVLTAIAQDSADSSKFFIDPNDDTTLIMYTSSSLKPSELESTWTMYLFFGSSPEELKESGFNKVRIYTSRSKHLSDCITIML